MCGIAGIISLDNSQIDSSLLKKMTDAIIHRGPDGEGHWINDEKTIGFGHRRLSIIDLSESGKQPMHYLNRYTITFNGEIYNFIELKQLLLTKGYQFISQSDTEVLLALYDHLGEKCLDEIDGMFAFAIWDNLNKEIFCARDRFGEKPFYYTIYKNKFYFASEMKEFFCLGIPKTTNYNMVQTYLVHNLVENPLNKKETFYKSIYKLEASNYIKIDNTKKIHFNKYWDIDSENKLDISFEDALNKFKELFTSSIKNRLRSDVDVGSSLSGGLDSSSIVAIISQLKNESIQQKTFSARFHNKELDEGKHIEKVTSKFNLKNYTTYVTEDSFIQEIDKVMYHQEEPFQSASIIAQWEVMKLVNKNKVTVLLDGQGADEYFAGYHKYFETYIRDLYMNDKKNYLHELESLNKLHNSNLSMEKKSYLQSYFPDTLKTLSKFKHDLHKIKNPYGLNQEFYRNHKNKQEPYTNFNSLNEFLKYDTTVYGLEKLLRFCDRNSMAFSTEVRLPFLNHNLVEFVFSLPPNFKIKDGWTKYLLRQSMSNVLPNEITWRVDKKGFQAPQEKWKSNKLIKEKIEHSKEKLVKEKIYTDSDKIDYWQALMIDEFI